MKSLSVFFAMFLLLATGSFVAAQTTTAPKINMTWVDQSGKNCTATACDQEEYFEIERKVDSAAFTSLFKTAADAQAYSDTTVTLGHVYTYRVRACNRKADTTLQCSGYSNEASKTLQDTTVPPAPANMELVTITISMKLPEGNDLKVTVDKQPVETAQVAEKALMEKSEMNLQLQ